jgi:hypothetical protein
MIEIYLAITQKQVFNIESLLVNSKEDLNVHRILLKDKTFTCNQNMWKEIISSQVVFQHKRSSSIGELFYMFNKMNAYKKMIGKLQPYKNKKDLKIYLFYIEDVLSNYLFFNFNTNSEIIIIEDGILNYYNHNLADVSKIRFLIKKIIAFLFGIPFKSYKGHSSGIEYDRVVKQFLTFPNAAFYKNKVFLLPTTERNVLKFTNTLFLVGQEVYEQILGRRKYINHLNKFFISLLNKIKGKNITTIYYKPRYKISEFEKEILQTVFNEFNIQIINNNEFSSEDIYFEKLQSRYIASFDSSSMTNIYAQLASNQREEIRFYFSPANHTEISKLFLKLGFIQLN